MKVSNRFVPRRYRVQSATRRDRSLKLSFPGYARTVGLGKDVGCALAGLDLIQVDDTPRTAGRGCDTSPETAQDLIMKVLVVWGVRGDDAGFSDGKSAVRAVPGQRKESESAQALNCAENNRGMLCTYLDRKSGKKVRLFPGLCGESSEDC
jgi:hypothetical protein